MIQEESLRAAIGNIQHSTFNAQPSILRSPGQLAKHYAPEARLLVLKWKGDADLREQLKTRNLKFKTAAIIAHTHIPSPEPFARVSVIPHDAEAFARAIYAELHCCDELGAETIVVEAPPETSEWQAIADRLKRASAD